MAAPQPPIDITTLATDSLEQLLVECESHIARLRSVQTQVVSEADRRQLPTTDGAHTMVDWVASRLDVTVDTAEATRRVAHSDQGSLGEALKTGTSFDRVALAAIGDGDLHPDSTWPHWPGMRPAAATSPAAKNKTCTNDGM